MAHTIYRPSPAYYAAWLASNTSSVLDFWVASASFREAYLFLNHNTAVLLRLHLVVEEMDPLLLPNQLVLPSL